MWWWHLSPATKTPLPKTPCMLYHYTCLHENEGQVTHSWLDDCALGRTTCSWGSEVWEYYTSIGWPYVFMYSFNGLHMITSQNSPLQNPLDSVFSKGFRFGPIRHVNVQSCIPIVTQYQPISLQYSWLAVEQPIRFWRVLYKHDWEFPIRKKIIPMLTCPIANMLAFAFMSVSLYFSSPLPFFIYLITNNLLS